MLNLNRLSVFHEYIYREKVSLFLLHLHIPAWEYFLISTSIFPFSNLPIVLAIMFCHAIELNAIIEKGPMCTHNKAQIYGTLNQLTTWHSKAIVWFYGNIKDPWRFIDKRCIHEIKTRWFILITLTPIHPCMLYKRSASDQGNHQLIIFKESPFLTESPWLFET